MLKIFRSKPKAREGLQKAIAENARDNARRDGLTQRISAAAARYNSALAAYEVSPSDALEAEALEAFAVLGQAKPLAELHNRCTNTVAGNIVVRTKAALAPALDEIVESLHEAIRNARKSHESSAAEVGISVGESSVVVALNARLAEAEKWRGKLATLSVNDVERAISFAMDHQ